MVTAEPDGAGERYRLMAEIGRGAMGVVYRAHDRETGQEVALKMLRDVDAAGIFRFKQEFRSLADVAHRNLVPLYELFTADGEWYFAMELIHGVDLLRHVRGTEAEPAPSMSSGVEQTIDVSDRQLDGVVSPAEKPVSLDPEQLDRLRAAMLQLVDGVEALHRTRRLHRDIKPSNVLVTGEGRVVLLDFGIVTSFAEGASASRTARLVGTPSYMAPEQVAGAPLSEASDWYALGVVLYEALTGSRPFLGTMREALALKRDTDPLPPSARGVDVPAELERLCMDLLARDPDRRPGADAIRRGLGAEGSRAVVQAARDEHDEILVGRDGELARLWSAFEPVRRGRAALVHVHGPSGMGKSALLERFLSEVSASGSALVLSGRCFERESVPYKAFDSVIDALTQHLLEMPGDRLASLLPENMSELARLFPVLRRIEAVAVGAAPTPVVDDPRGVRRRAFSVLRQLLTALARLHPLVLAIDDVQWGDTDSALLFNELLRSPGAPPLLAVTSFRDDDVETSSFLRTFLGMARSATEVVVDHLKPDDARGLAARLLSGLGDRNAERYASVVARESGGNPLLLRELVHHVAGAGDGGPIGFDSLSADGMLEARFGRLPAPARRLLRTVAVAGRPIPQSIARYAAGPGCDDRALLAELRATKLVRTGGTRETDPVETYHDRIREVLVAGMDAEELRRHHERLVIALEHAGSADPDDLAVHLEGAGLTEQAAFQYDRAGEAAAATLAFDKSAALHERAIELIPPTGTGAAARWARLGDALALCGRGPEAARAYRAGVAFADAGGRLDLQRRAAEQLLLCGHLDDGVAILDDVLRQTGISAPKSRLGVLASLLLGRLQLRVRGLRHDSRDASQLSREQLTRIDVCWTASMGLGYTDNLRGADFQTRHLLYALRSGEPGRVSRALAVEAAYRSLDGPDEARQADRLARQALELCEHHDDHDSLAWVKGTIAVVSYMRGHWSESRDLAVQAEEVIRERGAGSTWAMHSVQLQHLWSLFYIGEVGELARRVPHLLRDARERGDRYTEANLTTGLPNLTWLVRDQPDRADRLAASALDRWSPHGVHFQHYWQVLALAHVDLYRGDGHSARARLDHVWPSLKKGFMMRVRMLRAELFWLRARAQLLVAASTSGRERARAVRHAARDARRLDRERLPGWSGIAGLVRAGIARADGDDERALEHLDTARVELASHRMRLLEAAARWRAAELRGERDGLGRAEDWMRTRSIVRPDRMVRMLAPMPDPVVRLLERG